MPRPSPIPLPVTILYALFVAVLVPAYWRYYGPVHFLWMSDVVLLLGFVAVLLRQRLLACMLAVGGVVPEALWTVDFVLMLVLGTEITGWTAYMFDDTRPLHIRLLSLFHVAMPPLLLWLVWRWGYDARAWRWQAVLATLVLVLAFVLGDAERNINWVHAYRHIDAVDIPPVLFLIGWILGLVFIVMWPTHRALLRWAPPPRGEPDPGESSTSHRTRSPST